MLHSKKVILTSMLFASVIHLGLAEADVAQIEYSEVLNASSNITLARQEYGTARQQFIEYRLAEGAARGTVIFIHGGCWLSAYGVEHTRALVQNLSDRGWNAYAPEYRRLGDPQGDWPNSLHDVTASIAYLDAQHLVEPIWLVGHSAGGHLAALASTEFTDSIKGTIGLAPIIDLTTYPLESNSCSSVVEQLIPEEPDRAQGLARWSPAKLQLGPSFTMVVGSEDSIVGATQRSDQFTTIEVPFAGHFDFIYPNSTAYHAWIELLEADK